MGTGERFVGRVTRRKTAGQVWHDHAVRRNVATQFNGNRISRLELLKSCLLADRRNCSDTQVFVLVRHDNVPGPFEMAESMVRPAHSVGYPTD